MINTKDKEKKIKEKRIYWNEKFNNLPIEIRTIGSAENTITRINQLRMEKDRLKKRYNQSIKEINDHIKNLEDWLLNL